MAKRALIITATLVLVVTCALAASGLFLQRQISRSFVTNDRIKNARTYAFRALEDQLNEETGVRGYAATRESLFLEPFFNGRNRIAHSLATLQKTLSVLNPGSNPSDVEDARRTNAIWLSSVAEPLLHSSNNADATERLGKRLVDHYRGDIVRIESRLDASGNAITNETENAINRVGTFFGVAIVMFALAGAVFVVQQARLARRLGLASSRAEQQRRRAGELRASYEAEKRIADTLQEAFSQRPLPTLPMLRFSATYVPATEETKVGGDWYDALELPLGRVLFAIGDVAGHGIEAAVTMNRVRQALISSALLDPEPGSVLRRVNTELLSENATMVTAVAGFADAQTYEFVYASAGHPPPVLLEPGRRPRMLEFGSLPLGISAGSTYATHRVQSVPGAMLVLYTDGALEHSRDVIAGEELLLAATVEAGKRSEEDAATVIHNAIFAGRAVGDDVAILTVGFGAEPAHGLTITADSAQAAFGGRVARQTSIAPPAPIDTFRVRTAAGLPKVIAS